MSDISVTASAVQPTATTIIASGTAGATITQGQPLYIDTNANNTLKPCLATSATANAAVGIALSAASSGQPVQYAVQGDVTFNAVLVAGTIYVVSGTTGGIAPSADMDAASTWYATPLGVSSTTTNLKLAIKPSGAINA